MVSEVDSTSRFASRSKFLRVTLLGPGTAASCSKDGISHEVSSAARQKKKQRHVASGTSCQVRNLVRSMQPILLQSLGALHWMKDVLFAPAGACRAHSPPLAADTPLTVGRFTYAFHLGFDILYSVRSSAGVARRSRNKWH